MPLRIARARFILRFIPALGRAETTTKQSGITPRYETRQLGCVLLTEHESKEIFKGSSELLWNIRYINIDTLC
jgi:hypothetical protein